MRKIIVKAADWKGLFPAITTTMTKTGEIDLKATAAHVDYLIASGCSGIIFLGSLGENQTLLPEEKRSFLKAMIKHVSARVPVLSGVAESSTRAAIAYVKELEKMGADGYMLMPSMLYRGDRKEILTWFRSIASSSSLPVMIYNNPIAYFNDLTPDMLAELSDVPQFHAIKESSGDTRRITAIHNTLPGRYRLFTGVDNLALESHVLGLDGWVNGTGIAFQEENQCQWELMNAGRYAEAREIYRWFSPLLDLDVSTKFVQNIKLACEAVGLGKAYVREPRMDLSGDELKRVKAVIATGIKNRPDLKKFGWKGPGSIDKNYARKVAKSTSKAASKTKA
ncbi:MAG: hypothetical protein RL095_3022 [Verrucomicrobiota bacterium]|jgi:4-hydroxy-tetrahydrodipicolinate synthase